MELFLLLVEKLAVMFIFIFIGAFLFRKGLITESGSGSLGNLLINLILPCVIINGFLVERDWEQIKALLISVLVSVLLLTISIIISRLFFKKDPIASFASSFSNPGFFGIPLIIAVLGEGAVLYAAPFIACLNILQWTYGVSVLKEEKVGISPKKLFSSPFIIAFIIGLLIFFSGLRLPAILTTVISSSASLNTPIAMIVTGVYLAKVNFKEMFGNVRLYGVTALRLLLIPAAAICVLFLVPAEFNELRMCLLIAAACPVGSNVAVYAQIHKKDYAYAAQTVVISTIFSAVTIPALVMLMSMVWGL